MISFVGKQFLCFLLLMLFCFSACANSSVQQELYPNQNTEGLWGYVDLDGSVVLEHQWLFCDVFRGNGYALVRTPDGCDAIIRTDGTYAVSPDKQVVISGDMDGTYYGGTDSGVFWLDNGDRIAFFDVVTGYLSAFRYSIATDPWFEGEDSSLLRVTEDGDTYGYVNRHTGEQIIPYLFTQINLDGFHNGFAIEELASNGTYVIVAEDGTYIPMSSSMKPVSGARVENGLLLVQDVYTGLYGYCNTNCEWVISPIVNLADCLETSVAATHENEQCVQINSSGCWDSEQPARSQ